MARCDEAVRTYLQTRSGPPAGAHAHGPERPAGERSGITRPDAGEDCSQPGDDPQPGGAEPERRRKPSTEPSGAGSGVPAWLAAAGNLRRGGLVAGPGDDRTSRIRRLGAVVPRRPYVSPDARWHPQLHRERTWHSPVPVSGPRPRREGRGRHLRRGQQPVTVAGAHRGRARFPGWPRRLPGLVAGRPGDARAGSSPEPSGPGPSGCRRLAGAQAGRPQNEPAGGWRRGGLRSLVVSRP